MSFQRPLYCSSSTLSNKRHFFATYPCFSSALNYLLSALEAHKSYKLAQL